MLGPMLRYVPYEPCIIPIFVGIFVCKLAMNPFAWAAYVRQELDPEYKIANRLPVAIDQTQQSRMHK